MTTSYFTKMFKGRKTIASEHSHPAEAAKWTIEHLKLGWSLVGGKTTEDMRARQIAHFESIIAHFAKEAK